MHNTPQWKSDDLLEEAYYCKDEKEKRKLLKEALKINPDNIDAQLALADFEDSPIKRLKKYEDIVENATKLLENKNMFDKENIGIFWGIIETRPYMRARHRKLLTLIDLGRYTEACKEAEDMIRLCESDNLGIRYILLPLYCILEKFDECEKLYKKYQDESLHMVFTMAIMYFKKGNYTKAKQFLRKSEEANQHIIMFLFVATQNREKLKEYDSEYYSYGSKEEAFMVINNLIHLMGSVPAFLMFIAKEYKEVT